MESKTERPRKKRKINTGSDSFVKKNEKRLKFLTSLDADELVQPEKKNSKKSNVKPIQYPKEEENEDEEDELQEYEKRPRVQTGWMDEERRQTALPVKNDDGEAVSKPALSGPRVFESEQLSNKQKKRIAEKDAEESIKKKEREAQKAERKKKPVKKTEVQLLLEKAISFEQKKLLLAKVAHRINTHPEKETELFDIFFAWESQPKLGPLGILSCVAVIRTLIPSYRIQEKDIHAGVKLSYEVEKMHTYEKTLLKIYKQLIASLERFRKSEPLMAYTSFAQLIKVGAQFNLREKLIHNVCKGATHKDEKIAKLCVDALREVIEFDKNLEASRDIVKEMGLIMKAFANAKSKGTGSMQGITAPMLDLLQTIKLGQAERVAREDAEIQAVEDDELRAQLEAGSINASAKELKKFEVTIMTEIFVLYLRVFRCQHLQDRDRVVAMLEGLGKRASEVNLELMMELLDECRHMVTHTDVKLACMAIRCSFHLLAGPSASLMVDLSWLGDALVDVVQRYNVLLASGTDDSDTSPVNLLLETIEASLSCHQLRSNTGSQHNIARLLHGLVVLGTTADQHIGMVLLRKAQQIAVRFPKLRIMFDKEGILFAADGSLHDTVLSLYWHQFALKHHVSPIGREGNDSFSLACSRDPKRNALDRFAKTLSHPAEWLHQEMPGDGLVWPWSCLSPPIPQPPSKPSIVPFIGPKDLQ